MARNTSVILGKHFDRYVEQEIALGRFQSVSEVVRAGLRKLEEDETKLKALRSKLEAAEKTAIVKNFDADTFLKHLHKKYIK
jgi:antitoxin ParD1/3/4